MLYSLVRVCDDVAMTTPEDFSAETSVNDEVFEEALITQLTPDEKLPLAREWWPVLDELDLDALSQEVYDKCYRISLGSEYRDPVARNHLRMAIHQNVRNLHGILEGSTKLSETSISELLVFARFQAGSRVSQKDMQRAYRVSYFIQWRAWQSHLASHGAGRDVEAQVSRALLTYQDHVTTAVAEVHGTYYEALSRSQEHARQMIVRELCSGAIDLTPSDRVLLGYDTDRWHLCLILRTSDEARVASLNRNLRSRGLDILSISQIHSSQSLAVWIGLGTPWSRRTEAELTSALAELGLAASVGISAQGTEGFRLTHQTAVDVHELRARYRGQLRQPAVVQYSDVQLELLLLQNEAGARDLVGRTLGPLADETETSRRLRETLAAWFRTGSLTQAAVELGYHKHTVRNRVLKAEEILGKVVSERSLELQFAVRLVDYLSPAEQMAEPASTD